MSMWTAIVLIVLISVGGGVASNFAKARARQAQRLDGDRAFDGELEALKRRVEVLEKIITDPKYDLTRELERLERTG